MPDYNNVIDLGYEKSDIDEAKDWIRQNNIILIVPTNSLDELEELWNKWQQLTQFEKDTSNNASMKIFGINNYDHYKGLRNKFYNGVDIDTTPDTYVTSNLIMGESSVSILNSMIKEYNESKSYHNKRKILLKTNYLLENNTSLDIMKIFDAPYFSPEEMKELGIHNIIHNYYKESADNIYIDENKKIKTSDWFNIYELLSLGILTEKTESYMKLWKNKLYSLYENYNEIKNQNDMVKLNSRKQSILELGWNPEIDFIPENMIKANNKFNSYIESKYSDIRINDLSFYDINSDIVVSEDSKNDDNILYPIYIMLSFTFTKFGTFITKITNCKYSHATISFDPSLTKMFSFNAKTNKFKGGLSIENIKKYPNKNKQSRIALYAIFVKKPDLIKLKLKLDEWLNNIKNTSYSFFTGISLLLNKPVQYSTNMICSEFVDSLLKSINVDITKKTSSLVSPKDFFVSASKDKRIYKLYEGLIINYNPHKIENIINKLSHKAQYIKESQEIITESEFISSLNNISTIDDIIQLENYNIENSDIYNLYKKYISPLTDIKPYLETNEFPIEFDKKGDLLIKKRKNIDFEKEFANAHRLLKSYSEKDNNYAMAYELAKLWYLNLILEDKIYNNNPTKEELSKYHKARSKILNDFNKYLKELQSHDSMKNFNFENYYRKSPFNTDKVKVSRHTLLYSGKYLKSIIKSLLH